MATEEILPARLRFSFLDLWKKKTKNKNCVIHNLIYLLYNQVYNNKHPHDFFFFFYVSNSVLTTIIQPSKLNKWSMFVPEIHADESYFVKSQLTEQSDCRKPVKMLWKQVQTKHQVCSFPSLRTSTFCFHFEWFHAKRDWTTILFKDFFQ